MIGVRQKVKPQHYCTLQYECETEAGFRLMKDEFWFCFHTVWVLKETWLLIVSPSIFQDRIGKFYLKIEKKKCKKKAKSEPRETWKVWKRRGTGWAWPVHIAPSLLTDGQMWLGSSGFWGSPCHLSGESLPKTGTLIGWEKRLKWWWAYGSWEEKEECFWARIHKASQRRSLQIIMNKIIWTDLISALLLWDALWKRPWTQCCFLLKDYQESQTERTPSSLHLPETERTLVFLQQECCFYQSTFVFSCTCLFVVIF